ncbi:MAG: triose-phosphate isomerase [Legionellales bacterium]|nr:triose-phosphate isomerase [Legionellales bacterium]
MARKIVAGNWKMHGSQAMTTDLLTTLKSHADEFNTTEIVALPNFVFLAQAQQLLADSPVKWGAQNVSAHEQGAYTGETSVSMLKELGCHYVLVGHSERRTLFNESNSDVAAKFQQAQQGGVTPMLCVGETLEQREAGNTLVIVREQIDAVLELAGSQCFADAVIAYEPVWAIGTGLTPSPGEAQVVHCAIREQIAESDTAIADALPILYGGSVKGHNAAELFAMADIDGGLIGGASLDGDEFLTICRSAEGVS